MKENGDGQTQGQGQKQAKRRSHAHRWHGITRHRAEPSGNIDELAAQLAPLEEQDSAGGTQAVADTQGGAIVVDTGKLKLPEGIGTEESKQKNLFGIEPVVLAIVMLMLAFIIFIAWRISQMPEAGG